MTRTRWMLAALVLCGAAVLVWARLDANAPSGPRLISAAVTRGPIVASVATTGTLQPVDTVEVGSQVSGTIRTIGADFNARVTKGQVIATLDPALIQSQIAQAEATVARLEADLEHARVEAKDADNKLARARALARDQLIAASDLEAAETTAEAAHAAIGSAQAQIAQARAALVQNQVTLTHTIIRAPVDGIVLSRNVEVGQTVAAGLQAPVLFVIARDLSQMQVNASVDEAQIGAVAAGQRATFKVDAYGDETFGGTVRQVRLQPTTVQNVVNYTVVIDVANQSQRLKPGMTATITIETGRVDDALRVPASALRFKPTAEVLAAYGTADNRNAATRPTSASSAGAWRRSSAPPDTDALSSARQGARVTRQQSPGAGFDRPNQAGSAPGGAQRDATAGGEAPDGGASDDRSAIVWVLADGHLRRVRVTPGLAGGSFVEVKGGRLQPGAEVVTGFASTTAAAAAPPASGSPLVPNMPRRASGSRGR